MQFAFLMCLCILILAVTGALEAPCSRLRLKPFGAAFTALCVLAMHRFELRFSPEFTLNCASAFLPLLFFSNAFKRREHVPALSSALLLLVSLAYCLIVWAFPSTSEALLLMGGAALAASFLRESPFYAMFVASLVALIGPIFSACYELIAYGYASCDLAAPYVLDAQLTGMLAAALSVYFLGAPSARAERT